jgi:hypothetical protein
MSINNNQQRRHRGEVVYTKFADDQSGFGFIEIDGQPASLDRVWFNAKAFDDEPMFYRGDKVEVILDKRDFSADGRCRVAFKVFLTGGAS